MIDYVDEEPVHDDLFDGPGETRARCRAFDWSRTALGPVEGWPECLRTFVLLVLDQPFPSALLWGPELIEIHNDALCALLGEAQAARLGRPMSEAWPERYREQGPLLERVLAGEPLVLEELPCVVTRAGAAEHAWLRMSYTPLRAGGGAVLGVLMTIFDTTAHFRSAAALRESEARQTFLVRLGDALRPLTDAVEVQTAASQVLGEHLGASRTFYAELDGEGAHLTIHRDHVDGVASAAGRYARPALGGVFAKSLQRGQTLVVRDVAREASGSEASPGAYEKLSIAAFITVPLVKGGRWVALLSVQQRVPRDWTAEEVGLVEETAERTWAAVEQARAEAALRASEEKYRSLFESIDEGVVALEITGDEAGRESDYRIVEHNPAFRRLVGRDVVGERLPEVHPELASFWLDACQRVLATGEPVRFEHHARELDRWSEIHACRIGGVGSRRLVLVHNDITQRKRAEQAKDEFLATLGHELRTPLAAILLWGGALRSGAVSVECLGRAVDAILQSAHSQSRLIDDLLDLSRLTLGKLLLAPSCVAIDTVMRAALDVVTPSAQKKHIELELELGELPGRARIDAARLQQISWNLLSNAIKFTPERGRVTLRAEKQGAWLALEVEDTGEGITPDFLPHVFERFRQADMAETRQHGGLGIGLALSRELVELQGGTIEAHSAGRGQGARFCVRLPWVDASDAPNSEGGGVDSIPPLSTERLRGVTVLLVEDDQTTREGMEWSLLHAGAEVLSAASAREALGFLEEPARAAPDVVVSDLGLPGTSGYELVKQLARRRGERGEPPLPALAVSAHARDIDRERAIDAGFDLYLAKPITPDQLIEAVADLRDVARGAP